MAQVVRSARDRVASVADAVSYKWRTSLQVRVVTSVLVVSTLVIGVLGVLLVSLVAQRLLEAKLTVADEEIDRARLVVEQRIAAADADGLQSRLNIAREALIDRDPSGSGSGIVYDAILVARNPDGPGEITSPPGAAVPQQLKDYVDQDQVSYQYATMPDEDGGRYTALVIGTPASTEIPGLQVYLVMPLTGEESTLGIVRGLVGAAALVIVLLLSGIVWLFSAQVTGPVQAAARTAERFSAGHLRERMEVDGVDEMARLAISFNDMAESLSQQIRRLEEYGSLQRQFTSDVSHELRTPLTTVRMAAELMADSVDEDDPTAVRASELMMGELDRFEMLLADLLEISRHDAGVADLSAERVDVRRCIESAIAPLRVVAEEADVELRVDVPEDGTVAELDTRRVERILRNLIANAIDHSEGKPVDVTLRSDGGVVAVTVVDHGVGLNPGQEELVFQRFWRADPSRERRTGGTGLGLAIAREDATLHGGRLDAAGRPDRGSCFRLRLPVEPGGPLTTSPLPLEVPA
ncbi:MtrAB system histidine kinase MtrB [Corynebacterium sp. 335C]